MNEQQLIKAAESGDVSAMKTLAKFYAQQSRAGNDDKVGDVVTFESVFAEPKRDPELEAKAYKYFRMAAEAGDAYFLGTKDTSQDFDEAVNAYKWAVENGESGLPYKIDAAKKLIHIFELGEGIAPDEEQAAHWRDELERLTNQI